MGQAQALPSLSLSPLPMDEVGVRELKERLGGLLEEKEILQKVPGIDGYEGTSDSGSYRAFFQIRGHAQTLGSA